MIVSYETLRNLTAHLANCSIGLLLCDEGHRLKNSGVFKYLSEMRRHIPISILKCRINDISNPKRSERETTGNIVRNTHPGESES